VGSWLARPTRNHVCNGETLRHLEPQVMDLLAFLASRGGHVVSRDEIIDAVWEGRFIAETTLTRAIADLRRALGDSQRAPQYIETIPKRGYRLVADVAAAGHPVAPAAIDGAARVPREAEVKPGPVVLAFPAPAVGADERHSEAPECARIADRLASARRRRFVGRQAEIALFRSALRSDEPAFVALHVTGAGGVGKTTLLQEYALVADEAGRQVVRIDGRNIEASPVGFLLALSHATG
jgi:DNA-binding winged helix-turn-helix (wHTH) protein